MLWTAFAILVILWLFGVVPGWRIHRGAGDVCG
jgi:hypothetical protein